MWKRYLIFKNDQWHVKCLRIFYALSFLSIHSMRTEVWEKTALVPIADWRYPVFWLNWIDLSHPLIWLHTFALLSSFVAALFPQRTICRMFAGLSYLFIIAAIFSFGDVGHSRYGFMTVALILMFRSTASFDWARAFCLSVYFNAGLWKIRGLLSLDPSELIYNLANILPFHIARGAGEGLTANLWLMQFLGDHYYLSALTWLLIILSQLAALYMLLKPDYDYAWGWMLLFFHLGTAYSLGVDFVSQLPIIVFIFFIVPFLREGSHKTVTQTQLEGHTSAEPAPTN